MLVHRGDERHGQSSFSYGSTVAYHRSVGKSDEARDVVASAQGRQADAPYCTVTCAEHYGVNTPLPNEREKLSGVKNTWISSAKGPSLKLLSKRNIEWEMVGNRTGNGPRKKS